MIRIATVNNISAAGYRLVPPDFPVMWLHGNPAQGLDTASAGRCDAALLTATALPELSPLYEPVGRFGIAARGPVRSVLVFAARAIGTLIDRRGSVYFAPESRTSRQLFLTLCRMAFARVPLTAISRAQSDAHLAIGNKALIEYQARSPFATVVDLASWWRQATGLPFVFARWVVRRGLPPTERQALEAWLERSTERALTDEGRLAMAPEVTALGCCEEFALRYYQGIQYRLDDDHLAGLGTFLRLQGDTLKCTANG